MTYMVYAKKVSRTATVVTVREALILAGVPSSRVQVGVFGDPQYSRDRRVEMLLKTQ
jgi:hypothetical protein